MRTRASARPDLALDASVCRSALAAEVLERLGVLPMLLHVGAVLVVSLLLLLGISGIVTDLLNMIGCQSDHFLDVGI
jgi:hypothetical protein